jgi:hypothetical protein
MSGRRNMRMFVYPSSQVLSLIQVCLFTSSWIIPVKFNTGSLWTSVFVDISGSPSKCGNPCAFLVEVPISSLNQESCQVVAALLLMMMMIIIIIPFTHQLKRLNSLNTGYEEHTTKTKISHLLYMNDLKLIIKLEEEFQKQMQTITNFSGDIHMEFGMDRRAVIVFKKEN